MMLKNKTILITGSSKRIGKELATSAASEGANILLHFNKSEEEATQTKQELEDLGVEVKLIQADFSHPESAMTSFNEIFKTFRIYALVNNASIFESNSLFDTTLNDWNKNISINLTLPFLLTQAYAKSEKNSNGRIINILDWRALRPGKDHFAYTISKAGLAALTKSSALNLAPNFLVNGIALGAILPPADGGNSENIIRKVPMGRWAKIEEVTRTFLFLLKSPEYITGEIIHIDGGRHLV